MHTHTLRLSVRIVLESSLLLAVASALLPDMGQAPGRPPKGSKNVAEQKQLMFAKDGGGLVSSR